MDKDQLIKKAAEYAQDVHSKRESGHDWWHIYRVWQNAKHINATEKGDSFIVELAALLHDIADWKEAGGDLTAGPRHITKWLEELAVDQSVIEHVADIIGHLSYKGAGVDASMKTKEGMIVQDADRLDAIGAIGIGRTFAVSAHFNRPMHDPKQKPQMHQTFEEYKNSQSTTISHFYEKLLLLKDLMNTETAKKIAQHRHQYMEQFLEEFFAEWEGER